ncbi:MAG: zinc-ribbon domain-containing protein [Desulfobacterales bacterium]|nr:zinc-ribbon domain-containing protein [Desulfobacterales bacterium]
MIIACEECNTRFKIDDHLIKASGSKVRCSRCSHIFMAYPPSPEPEMESEAPEPEILSEEPETEKDDLTVGPEEDLEAAAQETEITSEFEDFDEMVSSADEMEEDEGLEDIDLGLDFEASEAGLETPSDIEIGADPELESEDPDMSISEKEPDVDTEISEPEIELPDMDFSVDESVPESETSESEEIPGMDFSDEDEQFAAEETGIDLSLEDNTEPGFLTEEGTEPEELDLSGIELATEPEALEKVPAPEIEDLGLTLSGNDDDEDTAATDSGEEIEEDLDISFGDEEMSLESADDDDVMSDIESMLESDEATPQAPDPVAEEDVEEEIDLSDIEMMLEASEQEPEGDEEEREEVELELDLEDFAMPSEEATDDSELSLESEDNDLSDIESMLSDEDLETTDEDDGFVVADENTFSMGTSNETEEDPEEVAAAVLPPPAEQKSKPVPKKFKPPKRKTSKLLIFIILLVILAGGGYGAHYAQTQMGIDVPFYNETKDAVAPLFEKTVDLIKSLTGKVSTKDEQGTLKIATEEVSSRFEESNSNGRLFVIVGQARNNYDHSRNFIQVRGSLFSKSKMLEMTEIAYCGNVLSSLEISTLSPEDITKRLANRYGDNRSNVKIAPGATIPFMVIFTSLPENLDEFTVEIEGSKPSE